MAEFRNVTIITGAVNETDSLRETVLTLLRICDHRDLREIVISCSPKITPQCKAVLDELCAMQSDVPIVTFEQKRKGLGTVVEAIERAKGSHCILLDSDMALDLECVPKMIEGAKKEGDTIVTTSRWLKGCEFYGYSKTKRFLNFIAQIFLRILYQKKITDFTNPFQIVPTELYQAIAWESEGFPIFLEAVLKPVRLGYKFIEIPTNCYSRKQGKSNNSFRQTAEYLPTALHIRFMKKKDILRKESVLYKKLFDE